MHCSRRSTGCAVERDWAIVRWTTAEAGLMADDRQRIARLRGDGSCAQLVSPRSAVRNRRASPIRSLRASVGDPVISSVNSR